jgi:lysozyme
MIAIAGILVATAILPAFGSGVKVFGSPLKVSASSDPIAVGNNQYDQYDWIILQFAQQQGLNPFVVKGQIMLESGFNTYAVSSVINWGCGGTNDIGLMQINPYCNGVSESSLFDAYTNIQMGTQTMGALYRQFGDISLALQAYNIGSASVQAGERNWQYSDNVLNWAQTFQNEHNALYGSSGGGNGGSYGSTYTVQSGDYLYLIGQQTGVSWQSIAQANGISSPYVIYVGQQLTIP